MQPSPFRANDGLRRRLLLDFKCCSSLKNAEVFFSNLESWLFSYPCFSTLRVSTHVVSVEEAESKLKQLLAKIYSKKLGKNFVLPAVFPHPDVPGVLVVNGLSSSTVLPCHKEIIVDHICGSAVLRGADVFIPGVKGCPRDIRVGERVAVYADLDGHCLKGSITPCDGNKLFLGNGIMKCGRQDILQLGGRGVAVEITESISNLPSLQQEYLGCELFLQNLPSILCSCILNPSPGDWVLDMCAAPGGKTTSLGILMQDQGVVIALDRKKKICQVQKYAEKFQLSCISSYGFDSTKALDSSKTKDDAESIRKSGTVPTPPFPCQLFDCVLLDAPCSALGQRPQLVNSMTADELDSYPCLQKKLFKVAFELLKEGGSLVYCTCSLTIAENEGMVKWALHRYPTLHLVPQIPHIGGSGLLVEGLSKDQLTMLQRFQPDLEDSVASNFTRFYNEDTIGFFIAKFVKN